MAPVKSDNNLKPPPAATFSSPLILTLVVVAMAVLSFIPLLAITGPGDLQSLYRESKGIVQGDRALFKEALRLLHECNVERTSQNARIADHHVTTQQFNSLKVHAMAVVKQLLESDGQHDVIAEHAMLESSRMLKAQTVAKQREAHLNATYLQTFVSAKRKLGTLQSRLERQTQASERLESQVERLTRELSQVQNQLHVTRDKLDTVKLATSISQTEDAAVVAQKDTVADQDINHENGRELRITDTTTTASPTIDTASVDTDDDPYIDESDSITTATENNHAISKETSQVITTESQAQSVAHRDLQRQMALAIETEAHACDKRVATARIEAKIGVDALLEQLSELKKEQASRAPILKQALIGGIDENDQGTRREKTDGPFNEFGGATRNKNENGARRFGGQQRRQRYQPNPNYGVLPHQSSFGGRQSNGFDTPNVVDAPPAGVFVGGFGGGGNAVPPVANNRFAYNSIYNANNNNNDVYNPNGFRGAMDNSNRYNNNNNYVGGRQPISGGGWNNAYGGSGGASGGGSMHNGWQQFQQPCIGKAFEYNTVRQGQEHVSQIVSSARRCRGLCMEDTECHAWTYGKTEGRCGLMALVEFPTPAACCVSGVKC